MKIEVCDVCYNQADFTTSRDQKKLSPAAFTVSYGTNARKLKIKVCAEHKEFFKGCKNFEQAEERVKKVLGYF